MNRYILRYSTYPSRDRWLEFWRRNWPEFRKQIYIFIKWNFEFRWNKFLFLNFPKVDFDDFKNDKITLNQKIKKENDAGKSTGSSKNSKNSPGQLNNC